MIFENTLCILEEKQQSSLSEWYSVQENDSELVSRRQKSVPGATDECNLLDDGGDTVFNQLVSYFVLLEEMFKYILSLLI